MPEILGKIRTPVLAGPPASAQSGELYFDSGTGQLYYYNGSTWVAAGSAGGATPSYPVGAPIPWLVSSIPPGYLEFDGQAISAGTYPQLAALFGTNLPDLRGKYLMGQDGTHAVGSVFGEAEHDLVIAEMPTHTHIQDAHDHGAGVHTHTLAHTHTINHGHVLQMAASAGSNSYPQFSGGTVVDRGPSTPVKDMAGSSGAASVGTTSAPSANNTATKVATNQNEGGGNPHNNLPPSQAVRWITAAG